MTLNQRAIIRGLNTWLGLTLVLGVIVQIIEFANVPEVCHEGYTREICVSGSPTAFGIGVIVVAGIGLIAVSSAKKVLTSGVASPKPAAAPEANPPQR